MTPPRPPLPAGPTRVAAVLLEAGLLVCVVAMAATGLVQDSEGDLETRYPLRLGLRALPALAAVGVYATVRMRRTARFDYAIAGGVAFALASLLRPGPAWTTRLVEIPVSLLVGAFLCGFALPINQESDLHLEGQVRPWRELFFGALLLLFGGMSSMIVGGFLLSVPTIALGLWVAGRALRWELRALAEPAGRAGRLARIALASLMLPVGLAFLIVCPLMSLGWQPGHRAPVASPPSPAPSVKPGAPLPRPAIEE